MKDMTMLVTGPTKDPAVSASHISGGLEINNASAWQEEVVSEVSGLFHSETTESRVQAIIDSASCLKSRGMDPFKWSLGNSSARLKMGERKSSARRSYSAQFVLWQDLSGHRKPFETPIRDFGGESVKRGKEATEDSSVLVLEESQRIETCKQDLNNFMPELLCLTGILSQSDSDDCSSMDNAENLELLKVRDQQKCNLDGYEKQNTVIACKEALLNLDNAADNLLQLFSRLGICPIEKRFQVDLRLSYTVRLLRSFHQ
ncbi:uncharacterized protein LOC130775572 [Actinidia eriantha]|uniref:uncharacterized protein LOC130775572 n=1 Tax=Actinidia eriantha TaxID=165200 RepID=UPI00258B574D|nr:uncharacterized protein LOC130775572 [Actinidia eriantha]